MTKRIVAIQIFLLVLMSITISGYVQAISGEPDTTRIGAVKILLDCRRCDMD